MLQFAGFEVLAPQIAYGPVRMEQGQRAEPLAAYAERLKNIASQTLFDVGIYCERGQIRISLPSHRLRFAEVAGVNEAAGLQVRAG
jgi:hypothetical protein